MIKPILYHSFEEKTKLEAELFGKLSPEKRKRSAEAWLESATQVKVVQKTAKSAKLKK